MPTSINILQEWSAFGDLRTLIVDGYADPHCKLNPISMHLHGVDTGAWRAAATRVDAWLSNGDGHLLDQFTAEGYLSPAGGAMLTGSADLALMAGVMALRLVEAQDTSDLAFCGEVAGHEFHPLSRPLAMGKAAKDAGLTLVCPVDSAPQAKLSGARVIGVASRDDLLNVVLGHRKYMSQSAELIAARNGGIDLRHVKGQAKARRALEIAVAGAHNLLFIGPPGEGKTLLCKTIPTIAPSLTIDQTLETTVIHQSAGLVDPGELVTMPPLRMISPGISVAGLIGGGHLEPHAGEVSLAHNGVLFCDELLQFSPGKVESLRGPLQDGEVTVSRTNWQVRFPSRFQLAAAANPCRCGMWTPTDQSRCRCTPAQRRSYADRLSGPVADRIDIKLWVDPVGDERFEQSSEPEPSAAVAERVQHAREIQAARYQEVDINTNGELGPSTVGLVKMSTPVLNAVREVVGRDRLSTRGMNNLVRVAQTIADLGAVAIETAHVYEAADYLQAPLPVA